MSRTNNRTIERRMNIAFVIVSSLLCVMQLVFLILNGTGLVHWEWYAIIAPVFILALAILLWPAYLLLFVD